MLNKLSAFFAYINTILRRGELPYAPTGYKATKFAFSSENIDLVFFRHS